MEQPPTCRQENNGRFPSRSLATQRAQTQEQFEKKVARRYVDGACTSVECAYVRSCTLTQYTH